MRSSVIAIAIVGILAVPGTSLAAGASAVAPGRITPDGVKVGDAIAGEIYGNNTNPRADGNGVTPTLTPGPWACVEGDCTQARAGASVGELINLFGGVGNADFANGTDTIHTNFGEPYQHGGVQP